MKRKRPTEPAQAPDVHPSKRLAEGLVSEYTALAMVPIRGRPGQVQTLELSIVDGQVRERHPVPMGEPEPLVTAVQRLETRANVIAADMQGQEWPHTVRSLVGVLCGDPNRRTPARLTQLCRLLRDATPDELLYVESLSRDPRQQESARKMLADALEAARA